jgi:hypothetical protein
MKSRVLNTSILASLTAVVVVMWVMIAWVPKSSAIPAFSRKYQTSCTTCHSNYPELNDFGEAFKKNGFKFPKDDESFIKEAVVMLGAKAQKEAFPEAVYPGEIPGYLPVAFRFLGAMNVNRSQPKPLQATSFLPRTDLFAPDTVVLIAAGSFGPNLSFWIDDDLSVGGSGAEGGLGDGYVKYNDLGRVFKLPKNALNVRFGQFELDLPFTQARSIYLSEFDIYGQTNVAGTLGTANNPFILGEPQRGIEFGGTPNNGNFAWSVTVANGSNGSTAVRNSKDVYVRVSQKFNLERDAASRSAIQAAGPTGPRDHTSIRLGFLYYYGKNQFNQGSAISSTQGTIDEPFYRIGGDIRFKYRHLEAFGLGLFGRDNNHVFDEEGTGTFLVAPPVKFSGGFAGVNYWLYPWMIATMRYDFVNSFPDFANSANDGLPLKSHTRNRFSPGVQVLVRANIKFVAEYQHTWEQPYADPLTGIKYFRPNTFVAGVDYVF